MTDTLFVIERSVIMKPVWMSLVLSLLNTSPAWAIPIPIINPGFEDPILADGVKTNATFVNGWHFNVSVSGVWNPSADQAYGGLAPEGQNISWDNGQGGQLFQELTTALAPNTLYTLQGLVGLETRNTFPPQYSLSLLAGSTFLNTCDTCVLPPEGTFALASMTYRSEASVAPDQFLKIYFGAPGSGQQTHWDQMTLDATPIPEPSSLFFLGAGALALWLRRWLIKDWMQSCRKGTR